MGFATYEIAGAGHYNIQVNMWLTLLDNHLARIESLQADAVIEFRLLRLGVILKPLKLAEELSLFEVGARVRNLFYRLFDNGDRNTNNFDFFPYSKDE